MAQFQRCAREIGGLGAQARQLVEERGFAGVGIARDGNDSSARADAGRLLQRCGSDGSEIPLQRAGGVAPWSPIVA